MALDRDIDRGNKCRHTRYQCGKQNGKQNVDTPIGEAVLFHLFGRDDLIDRIGIETLKKDIRTIIEFHQLYRLVKKRQLYFLSGQADECINLWSVVYIRHHKSIDGLFRQV